MNISQQRLKEIASIPDEKIDTFDIPELDDNFWKDARLIIPESKKLIRFCIEKAINLRQLTIIRMGNHNPNSVLAHRVAPEKAFVTTGGHLWSLH
jgi:hypothetical protein